MNIPEAKPIPFLRATAKDAYYDTLVYEIEGLAGCFRRVKRTSRGIRVQEIDHTLALLTARPVHGESRLVLAEFVHWNTLEELLHDAKPIHATTGTNA